MKRTLWQEAWQSSPAPALYLQSLEDDNWIVRWINSAGENILALSLEELSSGTTRSIFPQLEEGFYEEMNRIVERGVVATSEGVFYTNRLGENFALRVALFPVSGGIWIVADYLVGDVPTRIHHQSAYDPLNRSPAPRCFYRPRGL